jgi:hypothetical protein
MNEAPLTLSEIKHFLDNPSPDIGSNTLDRGILSDIKPGVGRCLPDFKMDSEKIRHGVAIIDATGEIVKLAGQIIEVPETHTGAIRSSAQISSQPGVRHVAPSFPGRSNVSK